MSESVLRVLCMYTNTEQGGRCLFEVQAGGDVSLSVDQNDHKKRRKDRIMAYDTGTPHLLCIIDYIALGQGQSLSYSLHMQ